MATDIAMDQASILPPSSSPPQPAPPSLLDRAWARLRSLFVPSVAVTAVLAAKRAGKPEDAVLQLYTWERDRLLTLSKGAAAAAVTVLTGLIASALESKVTAPVGVVYAAAALLALLLVWGGFLLTGLRRLAEEYTTALTLIKPPEPTPQVDGGP
jgi:hypothetical protein